MKRTSKSSFQSLYINEDSPLKFFYCQHHRPRHCKFDFGQETVAGSGNTPGKEFTEFDSILVSSNGVKRLNLKRSGSKRMTQLSTIQVQSWRANCDIQLLLYDSDPTKPNINEIVKVADYIVSYITKGNIGYMTEQKMMQCIIERYVRYFIMHSILLHLRCRCAD